MIAVCLLKIDILLQAEDYNRFLKLRARHCEKQVIECCLARRIELTRSPPYRKNDQAWIEQKKGAIVRKLFGYLRFEGLAAARAITPLYAASRLFVNFSSRLSNGGQTSGRRTRLQDIPYTTNSP